MKKILAILLLSITLISCQTPTVNAQPTPDRQEIAKRIALDFTKTGTDILPCIHKYFPETDSCQIAKWEASKALEYTIINGEKRYFRLADKNLFRIDPTARAKKEAYEGRERASQDLIVAQHIRQVLDDTAKGPLHTPHIWDFYYNITINNHLPMPAGLTVKIWLPYPSNQMQRQQNIILLTENRQYQIFQYAHSSAYGTLAYRPNGNNSFGIAYRFTSYAEYHPLPQNFKHKATDIHNSELRQYVAERLPHIAFSREIQTLADSIVGAETRPYYQARLLFEAMRTLYPWAAAREYSTIDCIPQYVIENRHGDCGQIALLYITLCRYKGIPARWQSGFMLHPGYENLHDWAEIYIEGLGWIPVDPSFGVQQWGKTEAERYFYFGGMDAFRLTVNTDYGQPMHPKKQYPRSETVDFQRGEVETENGNLYFDKWKWTMNVVPVL